MDKQNSELLEKIRQQFESAPYPKAPLEQSPKNDIRALYIHNLVTPYYLRNQRFIETEEKIILDAGCGSGYKTLSLAESNPNAKIVGIDISAESIDLAHQRLKFHGFDNVEFHCLSIENLPILGMEFDYINADEVLYLLSEPTSGLRAMKAVLKPDGIIRANYHSLFQRTFYFRAQKIFRMMGLMDGNPQKIEIDLVRDMMKELKDNVYLKTMTWRPIFDKDDERVLMNHLFQGDKGYTIPELFSALRSTDLEFISMVNWKQWDLLSLFKEPDNLPVFLGMSLPEVSWEEQLHLFELLQPIHRLLDFWCGHPNQAQPYVSVEEWTDFDWQRVRVYLHPQLKTENFKHNLIRCVTHLVMFEMSQHLPIPEGTVTIDSTMAACLLPLTEGSQLMMSLVERWKKLRPVHPVTLEPTEQRDAFELVQQLLISLERFGYVLLERLP
jgi:2-polyprenyl-3-methyl-5-hydroxy-6-metoxy-1,4-benzoquinol methylase